MAAPKGGNVNANFTVEGENAYECAQDLATWLKGYCEEHPDLRIRSFRYDYFEPKNPQSRLGGTVVDVDKEPSEASKVRDGRSKPLPVFKGGKDEPDAHKTREDL